MRTEEFVEAALNYKNAKETFIKDICSELDLSEGNIKSVQFHIDTENTKVRYQISVELIGTNRIKSESLSKLDSVTLITPKWIVFDCGVIDL